MSKALAKLLHKENGAIFSEHSVVLLYGNEYWVSLPVQLEFGLRFGSVTFR